VHVAIMTGRGIEDGAAIVNIEGLTYSGTHGLEWSDGLPWVHPVQIKPDALAYREAGISLLNLVDKHLSELPGVVVQRKRVGGSIHFRLAPHPDETRLALFALLYEQARKLGMKLREGKRIIEILSPLAIDKGTALRRFADQFDLRGIVFAGDDRTDLDAVREIALLQREGRAALSIVVRQDETLPDMLNNADILVDGVPGMVALLRKMVGML
ncbi:MAG TPA: trehalose-phosphatase, partial [Chthonomonadales bacterium]|nr:trehalose-phosphatase [Chthonomonadales bacterium]